VRLDDVAGLLTDVRDFYWRGRAALAVLLHSGPAHLEELCDLWPGEVCFAIRRAGRGDLLYLVERALDEHPDDPNVLANALIAFSVFHERHRIEPVQTMAEELYARHERAWIAQTRRQTASLARASAA
jgi:hypothetical protein